ncbi:MAG: glycosyltransferase family 4 protein [Flavobacteriales bacterium]
MKVLHILYQSLPNISGSSIRSRDILNNQLKVGLKPIVITSPFQNPKTNGKSFEEIDGIKYYRTFSNNNELVKENQSSFFIQIKKFFRVISFSIKVYKIAKKEKIDVIHAHAMFFCLIAGKITSISLNKPLIYEVRSLWEERFKRTNFLNFLLFSFVTFLETFCMFLADHIIAINQNLKIELQNRLILKKRKITVVENAVDFDRIFTSKNTRSELVFGYIGTISPIEGLDLLIEAFNNLNLPNKLLIFGDGIELENLKKLSSSNNNIIYQGKVSNSEIIKAYNQIDIIVNPRKSSYLTNSVTPLKTLEAMAYKKLVLASDVGGMKELIKDDKTGILFKSGDLSELEKALLKVLERDDLNYIKDNAYNYINKQRNWYYNAKLYKKLYSDLKNGE